MRFYQRIVNYAFLILAAGFILEGSSYLVERYLVGKGIIYKPLRPDDYESYLLERNPLLGWPSPASFAKGDRDSSGSRIIPSFPDPNDEACVSLYGDSFTWGAEVSNEFAWSNILSKILNCRVSNFGVSGYGTDQSYLRFKHNDRDRAKIVILGHLSENIVRNVNQFYSLLYGSKEYGLKPRFVIGSDGSLKLIPLLHLSMNEYRSMVNNPKKFLKHEYLLPGGPTGTSKAGFPYTFSVLKTFNNYRVRAVLARKSFWADFYREDHPSEALQITTLIIKSFFQEVRATGRVPVVVIFPWVPDLIDYRTSNSWVYQALLDSLYESNIDVLNIGTGMIKNLGQRDLYDLFTARHGSHYNEEGNRLVAKLVADHLMSSGLLNKKEIAP